MPVEIHGKQYITVAERLTAAHEAKDLLSVTTELLPNGTAVVVKATITTKKGVFTGISAANPNKAIEKQSPYEVAETSAVGRALAFAGYGAIESIASAEEMTKATQEEEDPFESVPKDTRVCSAHEHPHQMMKGASKSKVDKEGNPKEYWYHKSQDGRMCFGDGWLD